MSNSIIRAELEARLKTWADAQTPKLLVAFQNAPFSKPTAGIWLEAFLLPNRTLHKEVSGARKTYHGLFQINCWAPTGNGMGAVERVAQSLVDLYPMLPKTGNVSIEDTPSQDNPLWDTSGWVIVPVTIKYRMESN